MRYRRTRVVYVGSLVAKKRHLRVRRHAISGLTNSACQFASTICPEEEDEASREVTHGQKQRGRHSKSRTINFTAQTDMTIVTFTDKSTVPDAGAIDLLLDHVSVVAVGP